MAAYLPAEFGVSPVGWGGVSAAASTATARVRAFAGGLADRLRLRHPAARRLRRRLR